METVEFLEEYRQMWAESLDRLGTYLESVTAKGERKSRRKNTNGRKK